MNMNFGTFISEKRREKDISLRSFSKMIDISPEYLSKIENGLRSAPKDSILEKIADKLLLNNEEKELLFDLAAESKPYLSLASDLTKYICENEIVHNTLRLAKRSKLTDEEWQYIFENILNKHLNTYNL